MKLQVAIDRVSLDYAIKMARCLDPIVDIIEMGTSLIKDYGCNSLKKSKIGLKHAELLLDTKTIDEGKYEFEKGFEVGADILTVMGASSLGTLNATYQVAQNSQKQMLIDLMEVSDGKLAQITQFDDAVYGLHHSKDRGDSFNATDSVAEFHRKFPNVKHINIAGGINLEQAKGLREQGIAESVVVGGGIMKSDDPVVAAKEFMKVIK